MAFTTLNSVRNSINGNISSLNSISISYDQKLKGIFSENSGNSNGIYIYRSGAVSGSLSGSAASIVLEGGNPDWYGQLNPTEIFDGGSRAQLSMLHNIINYVTKLNPNTVIMDNR